MRSILRAAGALLALHLVFLGLMLAVQSLDATRIQARLREDVASGVLGTRNTAPAPYGHQLDLFTECIALSAGVLPPEGGTLLERALDHRYLVGEGDEATDRCGALARYVQGARPAATDTYRRYWHGYDVYLRPLVWAGVPQSRIHFLNLVIVALLCAGLVRSAARVMPREVVPTLLATLFLTTDLPSVPMVTTHAVGFMVCLASAWAAAAHLQARPGDMAGLRWIALVSGAVFAFVDFLVNPPLVPTLLAFVLLAGARWQRPDAPRGAAWWSTAGVVATWFVAWATSWAAKWAVSAAVFGPRAVLDEVGAQIVKRTVGVPLDAAHQAMSLHLGSATLANVHALGWGPVVLCLAATAAVLAHAVLRHRPAPGWLPDCLVVASPALLPILWFETLRNHSVVHAWFVFRSLGISLAVALGAAVFLARVARRSTAPGSSKLAPAAGVVQW